MTKDITYVTQTRFYSPVFNSALFDGPLRLYFAQPCEPEALRLYFLLQEKFEAMADGEVQRLRRQPRCLFVMFYPDHASYMHVQNAAADAAAPFFEADLDGNPLFGVCVPLTEPDLHILGDLVLRSLQSPIVRNNVISLSGATP